jgi:Tol biopolymer transport system component
MVRLILVALVVASVACGTNSDDETAATTVVVPAQDEIDAWFAAYSPDGQRIAWYGYDFGHRERVGLVDDRELVPLTDVSMDAADFAWMPDSEALLVAHWERGGTTLAVVDLEGRVRRQIELSKRLFAASSGMFVLNRDTAIMSAMTTRNDRPLDLYRIDLDSGTVENLTKTYPLSETWPVPIDESRWLITAGLFARDEGGPSGWMGIFDASTGETERLTDAAHFVDSATIAPGSSTAVFDTTFQRDTGLWTMDLDGGEPEQLLDSTEVAWPAISPDGKRVLLKVVGSPAHSGPFVEVSVPSE